MVLTHSVIFQWLVVLYPVYVLTLPQTCVFSPIMCVNGFYSDLINSWMPSISIVHTLCYSLSRYRILLQNYKAWPQISWYKPQIQPDRNSG